MPATPKTQTLQELFLSKVNKLRLITRTRIPPSTAQDKTHTANDCAVYILNSTKTRAKNFSELARWHIFINSIKEFAKPSETIEQTTIDQKIELVEKALSSHDEDIPKLTTVLTSLFVNIETPSDLSILLESITEHNKDLDQLIGLINGLKLKVDEPTVQINSTADTAAKADTVNPQAAAVDIGKDVASKAIDATIDTTTSNAAVAAATTAAAIDAAIAATTPKEVAAAATEPDPAPSEYLKHFLDIIFDSVINRNHVAAATLGADVVTEDHKETDVSHHAVDAAIAITTAENLVDRAIKAAIDTTTPKDVDAGVPTVGRTLSHVPKADTLAVVTTAKHDAPVDSTITNTRASADDTSSDEEGKAVIHQPSRTYVGTCGLFTKAAVVGLAAVGVAAALANADITGAVTSTLGFRSK